MKKGLINIILIILALTNVALSAIIVFAIVPTMNDASALIGKVAESIELEKADEENRSDGLSIDNIDTFTFTDKILVSLKSGEDGKSRYASFGLTLTLDKRDKSYEKYVAQHKANEELMKSEITKVVSRYTKYEVENNQEAIADEIVKTLRKMFNDTTFIYSAGFSGFVTQ